MNRELKRLVWMGAAFLAAFHLPVEVERFQGAVMESLRLTRWYAREHVLLCLVPAFFIAGAVGVFVSRNAVMNYFGAQARKWVAYTVASVSGTLLAVCSCTVLPLFGGIYMRGAGLGPATAFLYAGPAINVLAIVLTARVLGWQLGVARAVGAIGFSVVIGLLMHLLFLKEERAKAARARAGFFQEEEKGARPIGQTILCFLAMVGVLVFANWARPAQDGGLWHAVFSAKWLLTSCFALLLAFCLWKFMGVRKGPLLAAMALVALVAWGFPGYPVAAFTAGAAGLVVLMGIHTPELREWRDQTWGFATQIAPLLLYGVLAAGFFLGSPESTDAGIIPNRWIGALVGDSPEALLSLLGPSGGGRVRWLEALWPVWTNLFASVVGALMYFATLTEVPILRGLMDSGMGQGPALALLLAGPALSLPNLIVIGSILGLRKTLAFLGLVVLMATLSGLIFGAIVGGA